MATRTFLTSEELKEAEKTLSPPLAKPNGQVHLAHSLTQALDFSSWLSLKVENRLHQLDGWEESAPIAIGSWGRGELCPGSDLDIVFCGDEKAVKKVVKEVEALGMKFRHRVPEDLNDWTKGVEVLETNALFKAKAFTQEAAEKLQTQKELILKKERSFRRDLLKNILIERRSRQKRYDSIANFLEPNLKYGAGGLRDLHQAIMLTEWFPERFEGDDHSFDVLNYYKCFYLLIRHRLHLSNSHDILTAGDQQDISQWLGFKQNRDFMMEVQKGLSRVSFHGDWISERCTLTKKRLEEVGNLKVEQWQHAFTLLQKDPSLSAQGQVRKKLFETGGFKKQKLAADKKGQFLRKIMDVRTDDDVTFAAFRSHMVSHLVPAFTKVIGLVQHDQYHRFSVDAHILQAIRQVKRFYDHQNLLGKMQFYGEKLKVADWNILRWTALYHDIAKGQGGNHDEKGMEIARKDLKSFGLSRDMIDEVVWLVENHLVLSTAAFRKNPQAPETWQELFARGVRGKRLYRLAIFTLIDIIATNPEAWNSWKENLLVELVETLRNPGRERSFDFIQKLKQKVDNAPVSFVETWDPELLDNVPHNTLIKDIRQIATKEPSKPVVLRDRKGRTWVRFHQPNDEQGLLLDFTQRLTDMGCNIRQAFIYTDGELGAYDWFCVKTTRSPQMLRKSLQHNISSAQIFDLKFSNIELVSESEDEWVFSFRAQDKKGLLLSAIQALYREGLQISWAKVHTWGRQIDDIFGVLPKKEERSEQILTRLKSEFSDHRLEIL